MTETPMRDRFLQGMSNAAATVNVVTTDGKAGRAGVTVSAMSSVSADGDAPTMLVCVHHMSPAAARIIENCCFCANILRDDQSYISDSFAGRLPVEGGDKFSCTEWAPMVTGAPRVIDPLTAFDCKVVSAERVGTHHVFIGEVKEVFIAEAGSPLIFANRSYGTPVSLAEGPKHRHAAGRLSIGALHTFGPYLLPSVLRGLVDECGPIDVEIHEGDQKSLEQKLRRGEIDLAFLYEMDLEGDFTTLPITDVTPYVLLAERDPMTEHPEIALADLVKRPLVLLKSAPSRAHFLSLFAGVGEPNIAYEATSFEMVRGLVGNGLGYSILATKPASPMTYDGKALAIRPIMDAIPSSRLVLAEPAKRERSQVVETFLLHAIETFGLDTD
jgi:flavin reductase (DIM6/NTAB) family NADH-FMN oxidoreductase RutF/DNA-binding transcriptional LysR family regulator